MHIPKQIKGHECTFGTERVSLPRTIWYAVFGEVVEQTWSSIRKKEQISLLVGNQSLLNYQADSSSSTFPHHHKHILLSLILRLNRVLLGNSLGSGREMGKTEGERDRDRDRKRRGKGRRRKGGRGSKFTFITNLLW
jgi:hypothetical protein